MNEPDNEDLAVPELPNSEAGRFFRQHFRQALHETRRPANVQNLALKRFLTSFWPDIVGEILATHCQLVKVDGHRLAVVVDHPVFLAEFKNEEPVIKLKLKEYTGLQFSEIKAKTGQLTFTENPVTESGISEIEALYTDYQAKVNTMYGSPPEVKRDEDEDTFARLKRILFEPDE